MWWSAGVTIFYFKFEKLSLGTQDRREPRPGLAIPPMHFSKGQEAICIGVRIRLSSPH